MSEERPKYRKWYDQKAGEWVSTLLPDVGDVPETPIVPSIDDLAPPGLEGVELSKDDPTMRPGGKKWVKAHVQGRLEGFE